MDSKRKESPEVLAAAKRLAALPKPVEYAVILGIRRIKEGSFAGLWELVELEGDVSVKRVITDANTRSLCISYAARAIGNAK